MVLNMYRIERYLIVIKPTTILPVESLINDCWSSSSIMHHVQGRSRLLIVT